MEPWFSRGLKKWYRVSGRDLPWRHTTDPYHIWLSEIILQQTQVAQGLSYYQKFISRFPTVTMLSCAGEDEVLKLWQGLGYYSRARNLLASARTIQSRYNGAFPSTYASIRELKGVGDYTAAAVASFAFGLPHAVVDGNVYRLLSRLFGVEMPVDSAKGKKHFQELASALLDKKDPALHNQAIMEFGSQHCRVTAPDCHTCIFGDKCVARMKDLVSTLPVKSKRTKVRDRHFNYLLLVDPKGRIVLNRRSARDIWKGLYEFTLVESEKEVDAGELAGLPEVKEVCEPGFGVRYVSAPYKHILSHQRLHARFYVVRVNRHRRADNVTLSSVSQLHEFAFPRLIEKFLHDCDLKEIV